jgi:hypothetical protein
VRHTAISRSTSSLRLLSFNLILRLLAFPARDLVEAIVDSARFSESGSAMVTRESLDEVCHTYFLAG